MEQFKVKTEQMRIAEADFPRAYPEQLEFSTPARGTMNIVHTGFLIPESHEIYVCAKGCLRGVALTAAEMGAMGRYSALEIREENVLVGNMETMMIEGVTDIIEKLPYRPRAILIYISCQHFFLAYDRPLVFETLRERFPDIDFTECYMIPTLRKSGISPEQKMKINLYELLKPKETDLAQINMMGSNHALVKSCEIYPILEREGYRLTSINECENYDEYLDLAKGALNIIYEPIGVPAAQDMEKRLGIPYIYLPGVFRPDEIEESYAKLCEKLGKTLDAKLLTSSREYAEAMAKDTLAMIGDTPIAIDYTFTFRILNLARFLIEMGFNVTDIFTDVMFNEEEADFRWLQENQPDTILHPGTRPTMRYVKNINPDAIALGQKAAIFMGTDRFVNLAEGGGLYGYDAIVQIMELIKDAYLNPKDRRAVVQKKGTKIKSYVDVAETFCCCERPAKEIESTGMDYSFGLVPTYSSDEFGICSTLYELGGLVVMHDASGCNSTYTTHDEPRWYDQESMVYISALSEIEAIMGDDDKLIKDVCDAAAQMNPKFVALIGSPIPYMMGTDFKAIAAILEEKLGIPCFGFQSNGMEAYGKGISMATKTLVERFCRKPDEEITNDAKFDAEIDIEKDLENDSIAEKTIEEFFGTDDDENTDSDSTEDNGENSNGNGDENSCDGYRQFKVNALGATPLDFALNGSMDSIKQWLANNGMEPWCSFSMNSSLEEIERAAEADVNLVLTYGGLAAAKLMKRKFGIPFVCGVPYGTYGEELAIELKNAACGSAGDSKSAVAEASASAADGKVVADAASRADACKDNATEATETDEAGAIVAGEANGAKTIASESAEASASATSSKVTASARKKAVLIGEEISRIALAKALEKEFLLDITVLSATDTDKKFLREKDRQTESEDAIIKAIDEMEPELVIADPFYQAIVPVGIDFYPMPHEAFSGRIYDAKNLNLINCKLKDKLIGIAEIVESDE